MAYSTISKPGLHFNTKLFTGNGADNHAITGVGFQPDWIWAKNRANTDAHHTADVVNGAGYRLRTNTADALGTQADGVKSFDSDGFTLGTTGSINGNGNGIVSWNWKAGGGQGSSNTDGSINTTYTSVNTTAGFSISKWSGSGSNATIGHGLGVAPKVVIVKRLSGVADWVVGHDSMGWTKYIYLSSTAAQVDSASAAWNDTAPTNSVFTVATNTQVNASGSTYIAYCFAEKKGYSKFGSYTGNGNADGTFVYTGFKPSFIMYKKSSGTGRWTMEDNKRDPFNVATHGLSANGSGVENTGSNYWDVDLLSNGFKFRTTEQETNQSGQTFIYMAFGQSIVGSNNIPATAR